MECDWLGFLSVILYLFIIKNNGHHSLCLCIYCVLDMIDFSLSGGPLVLLCMKCLLVILHFIQRIQCQLAERLAWCAEDICVLQKSSIFVLYLPTNIIVSNHNMVNGAYS
jgi:hypothetical protein